MWGRGKKRQTAGCRLNALWMQREGGRDTHAKSRQAGGKMVRLNISSITAGCRRSESASGVQTSRGDDSGRRGGSEFEPRLKPFSTGRHEGGCQEAASSLRASSSCHMSMFPAKAVSSNSSNPSQEMCQFQTHMSHVPTLCRSDFQIMIVLLCHYCSLVGMTWRCLAEKAKSHTNKRKSRHGTHWR